MSRITGLGGGGRKSKQLFEARIASGLMKRAIKIKSCRHLGLNKGVSTTGCARETQKGPD